VSSGITVILLVKVAPCVVMKEIYFKFRKYQDTKCILMDGNYIITFCVMSQERNRL